MRSRDHIHKGNSFGQVAADKVVGSLGTWRFIIVQTVVVTLWVILNSWWLSHTVDPFPFILLNLAFSTQAAYASPLILMAANRQGQKDRVRDDTEAQEVHVLFEINNRQLEILSELRNITHESSLRQGP